MEVKAVDEETRYDRQVRLWGAVTQRKLKQTHMYFDGISAASSEMAKNMTLAGVNSIVIHDPHNITENDYHNNFLVQHSHKYSTQKNLKQRDEVAVVASRLLNPFVHVNILTYCYEQSEGREKENENEENEDDEHKEHKGCHHCVNNHTKQPFVNKAVGTNEMCVCVAQVKSLKGMHDAISHFTFAQILLLCYTVNTTTVATLCLYAHISCTAEQKNYSNSNDNNNNNNTHLSVKQHHICDRRANAAHFTEQLEHLLYDVNCTQRIPRQMQIALLQLHLNQFLVEEHNNNNNNKNNNNNNNFDNDNSAMNKSFVNKITRSKIMAYAMSIIEDLKLYLLTSEDIVAVVEYAERNNKAISNKNNNIHEMEVDAITATMCGAALAQFLILQIGSYDSANDNCQTETQEDAKHNSSWLLCDSTVPVVMIDDL